MGRQDRQPVTLVIEHQLLRAVLKADSKWLEKNTKAGSKINLFLYEHINGKMILVVPSFFLLAAENVKNSIKLDNLGSLVLLLDYLCAPGRITEEHMKRQKRLLLSYAMRLDG